MCTNFTHEEDMALWKYAIEKLDTPGRTNIWDELQKTTNSQRTAPSTFSRFTRSLLPLLADTKFHVETKLRFCRKYRIEVSDEFLEQLKIGADVTLKDGFVHSFQMKPGFKPNRDQHLNGEELAGMMAPLITNQRFFTPEEDEAIWEFALENCAKYTGRAAFWKGIGTKLQTDRAYKKFHDRFERMVKKLHEVDLSLEDKLKLYKHCDIVVDENFLEILKEHADLTEEDGRITWYTIKKGHAGKRVNAAGPSTSAKRRRTSGENDDLVYMGTNMVHPKQEGNLYLYKEDMEAGSESGDMESEHQQSEIDRFELHQTGSYYNDYHFMAQPEKKKENGLMMEMMDMMRSMKEQNEKQAEDTARMVGEMAEVKASLETSNQKVTDMSRSMSAMQTEMAVIRSQNNEASPKQQFILNMKQLVSSMQSPDMDSTEQRIDQMIQNLGNQDGDLPVNNIRPIIEVILNLINS